MLRHHAALVSGKLTRVPSGVNFPPSEVIMSRSNDSYRRNPGEAQLENKAKMSDIFKEMALTLFRVPKAIPSSEAAHATLLLTHVAWNRGVSA
jgi:hypothetical protein